MDYLLEGVIAERQVSLIAGASGSGKTRLIFQLQNAIKNDLKLFGYQAKFAIWAYISGDRTSDSIQETLKTMGLEWWQPIYSCVDRGTVGKSLQVIWEDIKATLKTDPDILVVDGFTSFCPGGKINDYDVVAKWLAGLQGFCQDKKVAILGACHTTKARANQEITDPRQQIAGSVAWAAYSEGVIVVDKPQQGGDREPWRDIYMCGRNSSMNKIAAQFNSSGWLELRGEEREKLGAVDLILGHLLVPGSEHRNKDLERLAAEGGISRSTFFSWVKDKKDRGILLGGRGAVVVPWEEKEEEAQEVIQ